MKTAIENYLQKQIKECRKNVEESVQAIREKDLKDFELVVHANVIDGNLKIITDVERQLDLMQTAMIQKEKKIYA